jgi:spore germination cell wall hydrolase CwlJ-like protein
MGRKYPIKLSTGVFLVCLLGASPPSHSASKSDVTCLAYTLFREANLQPLKTQKLVLMAVKNRMRMQNKSCMQIISQKGQFAFWHRKLKVVANMDMMVQYIKVEQSVSPLDRYDSRNVEYFHSHKQAPNWVKGLHRIRKIGKMTFYMENK